MTNTAKLNEYIQATGLKKSYIAKVLGVADSTLARKINNAQDFRASEIGKLCELLGIDSLEEKETIFFATE